jgi:hypothetical protein
MTIRKQLPARARIDQLKKQAKDLLAELRAGSAEAIERFRASHPRWGKLKSQSKPLLADAQLVVAREYGFASWAKLRSRVEAIDIEDPAPQSTAPRMRPGRSSPPKRFFKQIPKSPRATSTSPPFSATTPR